MRYTVFFLKPWKDLVIPAFEEIEVRTISNGFCIEPEYQFTPMIPKDVRFLVEFVYKDTRTAVSKLFDNKELRRRIVKENHSCFFISQFCLMRSSISNLIAIESMILKERKEIEKEEANGHQ